MSQENVELVRRWALAFDEDADSFRALTHPEIEWFPFEDNNTLSLGIDGAMQIRDSWLAAWDEHHVDIHEILDGGAEIFASVLLTGRGKESGVGVEVRLYGHFKVRDGAVAYLFEHQNREAALKAARLAE